MNVHKLIRNIFNESGGIRFLFFLIMLVGGYLLDEKFNTLVFLPIAFIIEGLLTLKYKSFYFYDVFESYNVSQYSNLVISDHTKFPGKYAVYWGMLFLLIGIIMITLFFAKGVTLVILFS